jgi:uncharacterized membrane protein YdjX (TVP38/TMEM64 family)
MADDDKSHSDSIEIDEIDEEEEKKLSRKRKIISIVSLLVIIIIFLAITFTVGNQLLELIADPKQFRHWIDAQGIWGRFTLVGIMCLQVVVAIMPGEVIEIGAGYAFGAVEGMILCLVGAAIGSAIIYAFTKRYGVRMVEAFISRDKINSMKFIKDSKRLDVLVFILFFIPGTPKDVMTYFIGLTPMSLRTFLIISSIARIPSVISSTIGGNALGMKDYTFAVLVFAVTAVVSLIGLLIYNKISKQKEKDEDIHDSSEHTDL